MGKCLGGCHCQSGRGGKEASAPGANQTTILRFAAYVLLFLFGLECWCLVLAVTEVLLSLSWMGVDRICFCECQSNKDTEAVSSNNFVNCRYLWLSSLFCIQTNHLQDYVNVVTNIKLQHTVYLSNFPINYICKILFFYCKFSLL